MSNDECLLNHEWPNVEWQTGRSIGDSEIRRSFFTLRVVWAPTGRERTGFHHQDTEAPRNPQTFVLGLRRAQSSRDVVVEQSVRFRPRERKKKSRQEVAEVTEDRRRRAEEKGA